MSSRWLDECFRRSAPDGDEPRCAGRLAEFADVLAHLLGKVHLALALLDIGPVDVFDVVVVEDGFARHYLGEEWLDLFEQIAVKDTCLGGGVEHVVFEDVPAGEDQIVETSEWDEFFDFGRATLGALAEAHGPHLGERTDGLRDALAHGFNTRDDCVFDGAHAGENYTQLALCGL